MILRPGIDFTHNLSPELDRDFVVETDSWLALPEKVDNDPTFENESHASWIDWFREPDDTFPVPMHRISSDATMLDALVIAKCFRSKSEARKNWKGDIEIPFGFSHFLFGKRKVQITIFKLGTPEQLNSSNKIITSLDKVQDL